MVVFQSRNFKIPTPWKSIVTSLPVWAFLIAGVAQCWGAFTLLTEMPSYMNGMLNIDVKSNSELSALPYISQFFVSLLTSPLSDRLISSGTVTMTSSRKIFQSLRSFLPAATLICLGFLENFNTKLVIVILVIAIGSSAFHLSGYVVNAVDMAPNHTGTLMGIVNGTTNIFSLFAPLTVGLLDDDKSDPIFWRKVFLLAEGIYTVCRIFFVLFSSAEVQPWNNLDKRKRSRKKEYRIKD